MMQIGNGHALNVLFFLLGILDESDESNEEDYDYKKQIDEIVFPFFETV